MKKHLVAVGLGVAAVAATLVFINYFSLSPEDRERFWNDGDDDDEYEEDDEFYDESLFEEACTEKEVEESSKTPK